MALTDKQLLILDNLIYLRPVSSGEVKTVGAFISRVDDEILNQTDFQRDLLDYAHKVINSVKLEPDLLLMLQWTTIIKKHWRLVSNNADAFFIFPKMGLRGFWG